MTLKGGTVGKVYTVKDADGDNWSFVVFNYNGGNIRNRWSRLVCS